MTTEQKKIPKDGEVDATKTEHEGYLEKVSFVGKGDWCVVKVNNLTCTGVMQQREMGGLYKLTGKMVFCGKYSAWQFNFSSFLQLADSSRRGIIAYLARSFSSLGVKRATEIYEAFGAESLAIIEQEPDRICGRIPGISPAMAAGLAVQVKQVKSQAAISTKLYALGLTQHFVGLLIKNFGQRAEEELQKRCFELTRLHGIGFLKAADVADKIGVPRDNPARIRAAIGYALKTNQQMEGHCCLEREELLQIAHDLLKIDVDKINRQLDWLLQESYLVTETADRNQLAATVKRQAEQKEKQRLQVETEQDTPTGLELAAMENLTEADFQQLGD